jgi:outer membrane protein assembly factor BamD
MRQAFLCVVLASVVVLAGCGRKKYENPIATDSAQPDKTLFDRAVNDVEKSRYEVARLTLQTLINTYPDSEYLAKAKLAIADTWYRQGGTSGLAQAEAEYKDFITFFPNMEEAVEAQLKVAMIHYQQMGKADRDITHAKRAQDEFKQLLIQFPNSKFSEEAQQRLRETQEVLADGEFRVGRQYYMKGSNRSAVMRLKELSDNYPFYSGADEALWLLGQSYERAGKEFRDFAAQAYSKIVSDYPLSERGGASKGKLTDWKKPVPEAKPEALARMKYEMEHRDPPGMIGRTTGILKSRPDVSLAAKTGDPLQVAVPKPPAPPEPSTAGPGTAGSSVVLQPVAGGPPEGAKEISTSAKPASETAKDAKPEPKKEDTPPPQEKKKKGFFGKIFGKKS